MSIYHSDKCDKQTLSDLKAKVIALLVSEGIDPAKLQIRALTCYGGDIRIYTDVAESINKKSSFRRMGTVEKDGNKTIYEGTKGKHITTSRNYVAYNAEDFTKANNMIGFNLYTLKQFLKRKEGVR